MRSIIWAIDVDGTLANNQHREHLIKRPDPDWDTYFKHDLVLRDTPIEAAQKHFEDGCFRYGLHVILTARPELARQATVIWLVNHGFATSRTRILMKPDIIRFQRSALFKKAALDVLSSEFSDSDLVMIEDQPAIIAALKDTKFGTRTAPGCWEEECWI